MLMALGSCCLVTCCNCMRLGATIMMGYGDRNDQGGPPEQTIPRQRNGEQRVLMRGLHGLQCGCAELCTAPVTPPRRKHQPSVARIPYNPHASHPNQSSFDLYKLFVRKSCAPVQSARS